jgi:hypothetical protein
MAEDRIARTGKDAARESFRTRQLVRRLTEDARPQGEARKSGQFPAGLCWAGFGIRLPEQYDDYGRVIREVNVEAD